MCTLAVVEIIWSLTGGCGVHSGSLGSFLRGLEVVGLIWVRWVHSGAPFISFRPALEVVGFIRFHSRAPWGSLGFIHARSGGHRVQFGCFGSHGRALDVVGYVLGASWGR